MNVTGIKGQIYINLSKKEAIELFATMEKLDSLLADIRSVLDVLEDGTEYDEKTSIKTINRDDIC